MRVVIFGAGTVGSSIADLLCQNGHSVTVIDEKQENTRAINDEMDVRVVTGSVSQSSVLFQAGISSTDVVLAVTGNDEVNIVSASMAKAMGAHRAIARVYSPVFHDLSTFDYQSHFGLDRLLSLEHLTAMALARGIRNPGSVVVEEFARGGIEVHEITVSEKSTVRDRSLAEINFPKNIRVGSIFRDGKMWIATADDLLLVGDRLTLIGRPEDVDEIKLQIQHEKTPKLRVVIAGGGETGYHLSRALEQERFSVMLIETDPKRCDVLANNLKHTTVVHADGTRRTVLEEERIGNADVFVACTGDDENNIMAGVEARDIGAKKIMAVIGRPDYANLVGKLGIDLAVSEREVMAKQILGFLNAGVVISRNHLPGGNIDVFEIEVLKGVTATQSVLADMPLPKGCLIVAVMKQDYVKVPGANDELQPGDSVVALIEHDVVEEALKVFSHNGR